MSNKFCIDKNYVFIILTTVYFNVYYNLCIKTQLFILSFALQEKNMHLSHTFTSENKSPPLVSPFISEFLVFIYICSGGYIDIYICAYGYIRIYMCIFNIYISSLPYIQKDGVQSFCFSMQKRFRRLASTALFNSDRSQ